MTKIKILLVTVLGFVILFSSPSSAIAADSTGALEANCELVHFSGTVASGEWVRLNVQLHDTEDSQSPLLMYDFILITDAGSFDVTVPWVAYPDNRLYRVYIEISSDGGQTWDAIAGDEGIFDCTPGGCTVDAGYWKTHSIYGPAFYDDTWAIIEEDTPFFNSGYSWYEVMNIPPKGNSYLLLAKHYIAAQLNFLAGADPTDIMFEFGQATVLLSTYDPDYDWKVDPDGVRDTFINLATAIEYYNEGLIGPGSCD